MKARSEAIRLVKAAFDKAGIEMPEPIYRIHMAEMPVAADHAAATPAATALTAIDVPASATSIAAVDVSADTTIEQQVQDDLQHSEEENLLPGGKAAAKTTKS